ncbi:diguanylate cyclase domain-containing protein [Oleiagrimonas soli]|uniref:histidine kinase n=1 Tax=Oleiagrimonas soli TaxID=1543381 RepID=A0A841KH71_9GAMM|nr:diguanylate cyclase [Oleiagrimonas soli]MBB6184963.1 diguanylate cyclase (GGDEF)-like protein [Oleiagrimonas soli]
MNKTSDNKGSGARKAARELAQLHEQAVQAREVLIRLQQDVVEAKSFLDSNRSNQLLEANERLVICALNAKTEAEAASRALGELSRSAQLDALTALPNRVCLLDRFEGAIAFAKRHGTQVALLFFDLDDFKKINDTLGHAVGDGVLKLAAERLAALVRKEDMVSRYGGDEFLVLLTEVSHASDAILVADKMIASIAVPCRVGDHSLHLTASIGISIYPDDGADVETLIDRADTAMYRAKRIGLGRSVFHGEDPSVARSLEFPARAPMRHPLGHQDFSSAEYEHRHAQLREANEELVLAALSAQELQAIAELKQRQQKDSLAVVAHELRNPLMPIRIAAEMIGMVGVDEVPHYQAIIEQGVEQMARLVSDLLDVSRASTGKLRIECQVVDLAALLVEAVDAYRPAVDKRGQHLRIQVPPRVLDLDGDPVRLVQIFSNLLDNASKYTPKGGEIGLSAVVDGDAIVITVSDNGIGITVDALPGIFEPFAQEPHAIGFSGSGLGIGLTVVRELVEAHGGTVIARSAGAGSGSQFIVTLPFCAAGKSCADPS